MSVAFCIVFGLNFVGTLLLHFTCIIQGSHGIFLFPMLALHGPSKYHVRIHPDCDDIQLPFPNPESKDIELTWKKV